MDTPPIAANDTSAQDGLTKRNKTGTLIDRAQAILDQCNRFEDRTSFKNYGKTPVGDYTASLNGALKELIEMQVTPNDQLDAPRYEDRLTRLEIDIATAENAQSHGRIPRTSRTQHILGKLMDPEETDSLSRIATDRILALLKETMSIIRKAVVTIGIGGAIVIGTHQIYGDTDGDGVKNGQDDCPMVMGPNSNDGCPEEMPTDPVKSELEHLYDQLMEITSTSDKQ